MDEAPDDFTGPVNLGNTVEMPILHLAETVLKLVSGKSKLVQARPLPVDDPLQRCPDITLARQAQVRVQGLAGAGPEEDDRVLRRPAVRQLPSEPRRVVVFQTARVPRAS